MEDEEFNEGIFEMANYYQNLALFYQRIKPHHEEAMVFVRVHVFRKSLLFCLKSFSFFYGDYCHFTTMWCWNSLIKVKGAVSEIN